jgi:hypothetical protein
LIITSRRGISFSLQECQMDIVLDKPVGGGRAVPGIDSVGITTTVEVAPEVGFCIVRVGTTSVRDVIGEVGDTPGGGYGEFCVDTKNWGTDVGESTGFVSSGLRVTCGGG